MLKTFIAAMMFTLLIFSCKKDKTYTAGPNEVIIQSSSFTPSSITVMAGTTIKWTNKDNTTHTVTSNNSVFGSGNLSKDGNFSFTFTTAGTYSYHCNIHPGMTGTVVVQ